MPPNGRARLQRQHQPLLCEGARHLASVPGRGDFLHAPTVLKSQEYLADRRSLEHQEPGQALGARLPTVRPRKGLQTAVLPVRQAIALAQMLGGKPLVGQNDGHELPAVQNRFAGPCVAVHPVPNRYPGACKARGPMPSSMGPAPSLPYIPPGYAIPSAWRAATRPV